MRTLPTPAPLPFLLVLVLSALLVPSAPLRADPATELRRELLAATIRAVELEIEATRTKLKAAEEGTGPEENVTRFRQKLRDLEGVLARFAAMTPEEYPAPVRTPSDPGSVLETSTGFGPVLPPEIREVTYRIEGPCAEGELLSVQGTSRSGPFYHLAGIAGGDYGVLKPGRKYRLELCLVYRREYFGLIGDYYVYVKSVR